MKRLLAIGLLLAAFCLPAHAQSPTYNKFTTLTTTGATSSFTVGGLYRTHSVQVNVTGTPATCTLKLEGSLDNATWFDLSGGGLTCTTSILGFYTDRPVMWIRGNLSALSGGSSPTVTVYYMGSTR